MATQNQTNGWKLKVLCIVALAWAGTAFAGPSPSGADDNPLKQKNSKAPRPAIQALAGLTSAKDYLATTNGPNLLQMKKRIENRKLELLSLWVFPALKSSVRLATPAPLTGSAQRSDKDPKLPPPTRQLEEARENNSILPIPEPATMFLFGTGLVTFAGLSRKKSN